MNNASLQPAVDQLFDQAMALPEGVEREAFVDQTCVLWPHLHKRLRRLLDAARYAGDFLEEALQDSSNWRSVAGLPTRFEPPREIGSYRLRKQIGEGGMGVVYLAEQFEPVRRQVALKLIRPGLDSESIIARFNVERQTLAMMEHPNIARILDAGTFGDADLERPFFVMELVQGLPITQYCNQHRLAIADRLSLFVTVCQAVHHAHQKGIIHRDLKPSNILVTQFDQVAVPKIIDFGVAKAVNTPVLEQPHLTGFGALIGTIEYMSPEQAQLNPLDVDTRSDIYSLGAILHELLVGVPPFSRNDQSEIGFLETLKIVQEQETGLASSRLSLAENLQEVADCRSIEPNRIRTAIRGELDWIVLKATEKNRYRRYESALDLARDIQRFLTGKPVSAAPPLWTYKAEKFIRRYAVETTAAAGVLMALLIAVAGTSWGLWRALQAESIAKKNLEAAVIARTEANVRTENERQALLALRRESEQKDAALAEEAKQRRFAEAIADFVKHDVLALTTLEGRERFGGGDLTRDANLRDILLRAGTRIGNREELEPLVAAELHWIVGVSLRALGESEKAVENLTKSVQLFQGVLGSDAPETLDALNSLGVASYQVGNYATAIRQFDEAYAGLAKIYGSNHPRSLVSRRHLAEAMLQAGRTAESLEIFESLLTFWQQAPDSAPNEVLLALRDYAGAQHHLGNPRSSLATTQAAYDLAMKSEDVPIEMIDAIAVDFSKLLVLFGELDQASEILRPTLDSVKSRLGEEHPATLQALSVWASIVEKSPSNSLSAATADNSNLECGDAALALRQKIWQASQRTLGDNHIDTLLAQNNFALRLQNAGQLDKAIPLFKTSAEGLQAAVGTGHPYTLQVKQNVAMALADTGQREAAMTILQTICHSAESRLGMSHPLTLTLLNHQGVLLRSSGRSQEAIPLLSRAVESSQETLGEAHPDTITAKINLAVALRDVGQHDRAIELYRAVIAAANEKPESLASIKLRAQNNLAVVYWQQKRLDESIPLFEAVLNTLSHQELDASGRMMRIHALANLGRNYLDAGRIDDAKPLLIEAQNASNGTPGLKWVEAILEQATSHSGGE